MFAGQDEGLSCQDISNRMVRRRDTHGKSMALRYLDIPLTGCPHNRALLLPYPPVLMSKDSQAPPIWSQVRDYQVCMSSLVAHSLDRFVGLILVIGDPLLLQSIHEEWGFASTRSITGAVSAVTMSPVFGHAWPTSLSKNGVCT